MRHSMRKRTGARNLSPNSCLPCWRPSSRATETSFAAARPEDERDGDPGSIRQARRGQAPRRARQDDDLSSDPGREVSSSVKTIALCIALEGQGDQPQDRRRARRHTQYAETAVTDPTRQATLKSNEV